MPSPRPGTSAPCSRWGYDLFHLLHRLPRGKLPPKLLRRLKRRETFQEARYEIAVAATFARADFDIEFLHDKKHKHPEFLAKDVSRGIRIAVEAKSRHRPGVLDYPGEIDKPKALRGDMEDLLNDAFRQAPGDCPFMIFVDLNVPPVRGIPLQERAWFQDVRAFMESLEEPTPNKPEDFNALFLMSFPFHWQGTNPATLEPTLHIIPLHARHSLPGEVMARVVGAVHSYGIVPREI